MPAGFAAATTAAGQDDTVGLWNVTDPSHPVALGQPLGGHTGFVYSVAFSRDDHVLASSSGDQTVRLWNVADPAHPSSLGQAVTGHTAPIDDVAFSPDGLVLASASDDHTVHVTLLDADKAVHRICATTANILTREQWQKYIPEAIFTPPC